jgi:hypothetical protein
LQNQLGSACVAAATLPDIDSDETCLGKQPKRMKTRVLSQASEDAQGTRANTEASFNLDSETEFTGPCNTTEAGESDHSDEEEWKYSQLDEMAAKDTRVSNNLLNWTASTHCE